MKSFPDEKLILNKLCQSRIRKAVAVFFKCCIERLPRIYNKEMGFDKSQQ